MSRFITRALRLLQGEWVRIEVTVPAIVIIAVLVVLYLLRTTG